MARKTKRKAKIDPLIAEKQKKLQGLIEFLHDQGTEYVANLNAQCKTVCDEIYKLYDDHLKAIPENRRNMTIQEVMDMQQQEVNAEDSDSEDLESVKQLKSTFERHKIMSEKKKTHRMSRLERKRSLSCSSVKSKPGNHPSTFGQLSRILSESTLNTPVSKKSVAPAFAITPKFNPKAAPLNKNLLRKPRAGEIVMSVDGSPLHNILDDIAGRPGLAVSLGCGKVVNILADKKIENLVMDDTTKTILEGAKRQLEEILKGD